MPKEFVHDDGGMFSVQVNWGRDSSHVQIATVIDPHDEKVKNLSELISTWDDETCELSTGLFSTLDRYKINQLIRVLRRARDQAFGKDE